MRKHEHMEFMKSVKDTMASEYERIQRRVLEDPGTAGDQAEENWAEFLRNWLPANYPIVTKGRILNSEGITSPQVDILVLHPSYPLHSRDKKHYIAGGVIAAFECKLTLQKKHLKSVFENSVKIKKTQPPRKGTPYDEFHQPPIFGVLAHSSTWKKKNENALGSAITDCCYKFCRHPREMPDIFCIPDLSAYLNRKHICIGPYCQADAKEIFDEFNKDGGGRCRLYLGVRNASIFYWG